MPVGGDMRRVVHWLAALTILGFALAPPVTAQQADDADALNAKVIRLYHEGKYFEATLVAERALAIREKVLGPDPRCRHRAQQPGRAIPGPGPHRRGRAALPARSRHSREGARPRPPRCRHRAQQPGLAVQSPGPLRRGRAALQALPSASARRRSAPTIPMWPPRSTTWPRCTKPRAATARPSRSSSARSPFERRRRAPTTPMSP